MIYGIVGSRKRTDEMAVRRFVRELNADDIVISGGCRGVDSWAVDEARNRGIQTREYLPELPPSKSPRYLFTRAYHARNQKIAAACDVLIAFVSGERKGGTENTIEYAQKIGKKVRIF